MRIIFLIVVVFGGGARAALGAIRAELIPVSARDGAWEMLRVEVSGVSAGEVTVRDARGGPAVVRDFTGGVARVPLPLVGAGQLVKVWPLDIQVNAQGKQVERARVEVPLSVGGKVVRIVVEKGNEADVRASGLLLAAEADLPAEVIELPADEILSGAGAGGDGGEALLFGGTDVIVLSKNLRQHIDERRAAELMAAGVRLAAVGENAPGEPGLAHFVWQKVEGQNLWRCPQVSLPPARVIEPGLAQVMSLRERARPTPGILAAVLLVGPGAVVLVLLARGLFRRRWVVMVAAAAALAGLTAGVVGAMKWADVAEVRQAAWRVTRAPQQATAGAVALEETVYAYSSLFGGEVRITGQADGLLIPIAATVGEYWAMDGLKLLLDKDGEPARLEGTMAPRSVLNYLVRRVPLAGEGPGLMPAYPQTAEQRERFDEMIHGALAGGWWVRGGYVFPGKPRPGQEADEKGELLTQWAQWQGPAAESIKAWYQMRFDGRRRYFLRVDGRLDVIDFGEAAADKVKD